jgi:hypothetical protein
VLASRLPTVAVEEVNVTALFQVLYTLALLSQVFVISFYLPGRAVDAAVLERSDQQQADAVRYRWYLHRNRFAAALGLVPLLVAWLSDFEGSLTTILLATGLLFFLQGAALFADREVRSLFSDGRGMAQAASRTLVLGAVAAYVAYVAASVINQNEAAATQWAKLQVVTLANVAFVFLVVANLVRVRRASTEESRVRRQELGRSINVLAIISIGLSVYFFGKDVLRDLDVPELRPLMMSVFVQALALLTVHAQLGDEHDRVTKAPPGISLDTSRSQN